MTVAPDALEVTGGVGGIAATYGRVLALATAYDDLGDRLRDRARAALAVSADPDLLATAVLAPGSFAAAQVATVAAATGPDGALVASAGWEVDAVAVRAVVASLALTDGVVADGVASLAHGAGHALGPPIVGAGLLALPVLAAQDPAALARLADRLDGATVAHPDAVGPLVLAGAGALDALLGGPPLLPADLPATAGLLAAAYGGEGPPTVERRIDLEPTGLAPPRDVEDLMAGLRSTAALAGAAPGTIAVDTLNGPEGRRHLVHLPGSDDMTTWPWTRDDDVRDLGTNLRLMAGDDTTYGAGVLAAMRAAGVRPGEPVLLTGHSQGGMQAVALAARDTPYDVRQVVTAGSPTGSLIDGSTVGADVSVLALEHRGDVVPLLDGAANPDTARTVTVGFDAGAPASGTGGVVDRHALGHYVDGAAAIDASDHPSLVDQRDRMADLGFLDADEAERRVFAITR